MSLPKWASFIQQCLVQRVYGDEFQDMASCMIERHHVTGQAVLDIVIRCRGSFCLAEDPLIPLYVRALVTLGLVKMSEVLFTLVQIWNQSDSRKRDEELSAAFSRADAAIVWDMTTAIASSGHREDRDTTRTSLTLSSRWLSAMMKWLSELSSPAAIHPIVTLIEATGSLIAALASSDNGMAVLADKYRSGELRGLLSIFATDGEFSEPRDSVKRALDATQPYMATVSMPLHERLDAVQKHFDLFGHAPNSSLDSGTEHSTQIDPLRFESTILDGIPVRTRAGLFVYFNAAVSFGWGRLNLRAADWVALWQAAGGRPQSNLISERSLCRESPPRDTCAPGETRPLILL